MFDDMYTQLIKRVPYRVLMFIPIVLSILLIPVILSNGIPLGIDFRGGTWIDIATDRNLDSGTLKNLESDLKSIGLEDITVYLGKDVETGGNKLTVVTTTAVNESGIISLMRGYAGEILEADVATTQLKESPPAELKKKLENRLKQRVDLEFDKETNTLKITGLDLNKEYLEGSLAYYLNSTVTVNLQKRNINIRAVGPTLGKTFMDQGIQALTIGYLLMALVIFVAFRDFIPSIAVMLAATTDVVIALGGMSILGIPLEPASLVALLMLIGYSVDTDILLTARVLKKKTGDINEKIDDAMKTGLTMTMTTLAVMVVILIVSTAMTQISTLSSIASVLLIGLFADIMGTWFMNTGILKWYLENKERKKQIK